MDISLKNEIRHGQDSEMTFPLAMTFGSAGSKIKKYLPMLPLVLTVLG